MRCFQKNWNNAYFQVSLYSQIFSLHKHFAGFRFLIFQKGRAACSNSSLKNQQFITVIFLLLIIHLLYSEHLKTEAKLVQHSKRKIKYVNSRYLEKVLIEMFLSSKKLLILHL